VRLTSGCWQLLVTNPIPVWAGCLAVSFVSFVCQRDTVDELQSPKSAKAPCAGGARYMGRRVLWCSLELQFVMECPTTSEQMKLEAVGYLELQLFASIGKCLLQLLFVARLLLSENFCSVACCSCF
jgi:hypothetical protein